MNLSYFELLDSEQFFNGHFNCFTRAYAGADSIRQQIDSIDPLSEARMEHCCHITKRYDRQSARLEGLCRMLRPSCRKVTCSCIRGWQRHRNSVNCLPVLVPPEPATKVV